MIDYVIHAVGYSFLSLLMTSTFFLLLISVYDALSGCVKNDSKTHNVELESKDFKGEEKVKKEEIEEIEIEEIKLITQIVENNAIDDVNKNDVLQDNFGEKKPTETTNNDDGDNTKDREQSDNVTDDENTNNEKPAEEIDDLFRRMFGSMPEKSDVAST